MTCSFDVEHYEEILEAARRGGYRFGGFEHEPEAGTILLRHDVDLSLAAAVELAELEQRLGIRSTYFLMTASDFYNLDAPAGEEAIARLRALRHAVGLHARYPRVVLDERFDPVIAWHNPDPEYMRKPVAGVVNAMEPRFAANYRSDSNQRWRQGCPCEELAAGSFEWLQLLTHPEIWVFDGETMRDTMLSMLAADQELRLAWLAGDRIDLS
jgi:hypothetical protein